MRRRPALWLLTAATIASAPVAAGAQTEKPQSAQRGSQPHIVFILADDLGWKDVGFNGSDIKTPNIDRLADTGLKLQQLYAQPMCTPTRAALLTGRYPMRYGLQTLVILPDQTYGLPTTERTLPQALREAGYSTALVGKWHLGHAKREYWPRQRGFDYHYGPLIGEIDYFTHEMHGQRDWYRNNQPLTEKGYVTTLLGRDAVRLIGAHDPAKPFFMYLAFTAPHTPFQAPQDYLDRYKHVADPQRRAYSAMVTAMDDQIGNVVKALETRGMRDNTIIVFQSDNGGTRSALLAGQIETRGALPADNGPFREGKGSLYEGGTRVAGLVNWPGRIRPGTLDQPVHVVDWFPTLTTRAGGKPGGGLPLDGIDMWPALSEGKPSPRREIVYNVEMFRGAVRQGDWKLFWRTTLPSKIELYDLAKDPSETTNLADQNSALVADLQRRILGLSNEMAKSLFLAATFEALKSAPGGPMALPNEDAFYESDTP
ncbi:MAG: arylsulfatase [Pseudorhodoplanes sp.]|uniref:arylsulfatase B n=1 Tax=Pseudorhodoplanes sp. TaxID=1934341 RepID=UPI003D0EFBFC